MKNKKRSTPVKLEEFGALHRDIKKDILKLLERCNSPSMSKEKVKDELFKIYLKVK